MTITGNKAARTVPNVVGIYEPWSHDTHLLVWKMNLGSENTLYLYRSKRGRWIIGDNLYKGAFIRASRKNAKNPFDGNILWSYWDGAAFIEDKQIKISRIMGKCSQTGSRVSGVFEEGMYVH